VVVGSIPQVPEYVLVSVKDAHSRTGCELALEVNEVRLSYSRLRRRASWMGGQGVRELVNPTDGGGAAGDV